MAKKWKRIIGELAPTLGSLLLGPTLGTLAANTVAVALGLPVDAKESEIARRVSNLTSEDIVKIKQAETDLEKTLSDNDVEIERINASDRGDARRRQRETNDTTPRNLAYFITFGFFANLSALFAYGSQMDPEVHTVMMLLTGALTREMGAVYQFFFGSSKGSAKKTEQIHEMHRNGNT